MYAGNSRARGGCRIALGPNELPMQVGDAQSARFVASVFVLRPATGSFVRYKSRF